MITIFIDGNKYKIKKEKNILEACLSVGLDIPYFCWHPILGSIGSCRQCAVKQYINSKDTNGKLVMSCMTQVMNKSIISINDSEAKTFRKNIIEYLMINHPHDCPICEEAGQCHLQDMTIMNEHYKRRYRFKKRTHNNQNLGPFVSHNMNRCITCYRCVRFYKEYAGGSDLNVYGFHDNIYFGRLNDGNLENEFSGNLIEICPTGVFGDKINSKNYNRKWDMQFSPSICHQCSVGCNISLGGRQGVLKKIENRYNGTINHYFLCDRGRFGYEYVNIKNKFIYSKKNKKNVLIEIKKNEAIKKARNILKFSKRTIGIGSPRASIESNFSLLELVGYKNFFSGIIENEHQQTNLILNILKKGGIHTPSLREIESYDTILILGEDITQTSPRISLAVRQAMKNKLIKESKKNNIPIWDSNSIENLKKDNKNFLFITNTYKTKLDDISSWNYYSSIEDQIKFGFSIANHINNSSPYIKNTKNYLINKINYISNILLKSKKPLIISGMNSGNISIIKSAYNIARSLKINGNNVGIVLLVNYVNSLGLALLKGKSLDKAVFLSKNKKIDSLVILENDLYYHQTKSYINNFLSKIKNIIILDHLKTKTYKKGTLNFSVANFAESSGTVINYEGRAQRFFKCLDYYPYNKKIKILESWKLLNLININFLKKNNFYKNLDEIINKISSNIKNLKKLKNVSLSSNILFNGQKLSRSPNRYSGISSMYSTYNINEPKTSQDKDTIFSFSPDINNSPEIIRKEIPFAWYPGWNSNQSWNKFQKEIGGHLKHGDPGLILFKNKNIKLNWFNKTPIKFFYKKNQYNIISFWSLFGNDETSRYSSTIQKVMIKSYVYINKNDFSWMKLKKNSLLSFYCLGEKIYLPIKFNKKINIGHIGLSIGFPNIPKVFLGSIAKNFLEINI
ncbi:NADH-quinone oxidoreductase subunit NuoG [Sodalis-like secondary symbiont of Drepanosiphum platanoidis]|uniref:NADH-quinone oxidoreductase subunit NuoG n=1 Tax=Sodalis-like secondary symbiont of Drepanosiphum platanoidis TaxID=2994493 RepID=UPI003464C9F8